MNDELDLSPEERPRHFEAWALFAGGLTTAASLVLFATGRHREAYTLGVATALLGASVGAIRILAASDPVRSTR